MNLIVKHDCKSINWETLMDLLKSVGMGTYTPELHQNAFEHSYRVVFLFDGDELVGCGRIISDGAYQGALYDVVVKETYQGYGLGKRLMDELLDGLGHLNLILYASLGKESFYKKHGFKSGKTCMVRFINEQRMKEVGLI